MGAVVRPWVARLFKYDLLGWNVPTGALEPAAYAQTLLEQTNSQLLKK